MTLKQVPPTLDLDINVKYGHILSKSMPSFAVWTVSDLHYNTKGGISQPYIKYAENTL